MASLASKITFTVSCLLTGGTIYYVHYQQAEDRIQLRKGIELEEERREEQKRINLVRLQQQADLTRAYKTANKRGENFSLPRGAQLIIISNRKIIIYFLTIFRLLGLVHRRNVIQSSNYYRKW